MLNDTRPYMVFTSQAAANVALASVTNLAFKGRGNDASTVYLDPVIELKGESPSRWALQYPTDVTWMAEVDKTTFVEATDIGPTAVGVQGMVSKLTPPLSLLRAFPPAVKAKVIGAAIMQVVGSGGADVTLLDMILTLVSAGTVILDTAEVQAGFAGLVAAKFMTQDEANTTLAPVGLLPQESWK